MKNTIQLYTDESKTVKGYPITSPDRVLYGDGKSIKDKLKKTVKFDVVGEGDTTPPIEGEIDKIKESVENISELFDKNTNAIDGVLKPEWFGAKYNGNDDTNAFINVIREAEKTGKTIILSKDITIRNEIQITKAITIDGNCESGHTSLNRQVSKIIFENNELDSDGNASKCLFRLKTKIFNYELYHINLRNVSIVSKSTVKNQHAVIIDNTRIVYSNFENLKFRGFSGYCFYSISTNRNIMAYAHYLTLKNIYCFNVGGMIGNNGVEPWFHTCTVDNLNLEEKVNITSPQTILADFKGFRNSKIEGVIIEGTNAVGTTTAIRNSNENNSFKKLYFELKVNEIQYILESTSTTYIEGLYGLTKTSKLKVSGKGTVVTLENCSGFAGNECLEITDASLIIKGQNIGGSFNSGKQLDNIFVETNRAGFIVLDNVSSSKGMIYSQNISKELFSLNKGVPFKNGEKLNSYVTVSSNGTFPNVESYFDSNAGRCVKITPSNNENINWANFKLTIPNEFVGSVFTVGMKIKVNADVVANMELPVMSNCIQLNGIISDNYRKNEWVYCYGVVVPTNTSFTVGFGWNKPDFKSVHTVYIADLKINLGGDVPTLEGYFDDNVQLKSTAHPTTGYWKVGDTCVNSSPTAGGYLGWVCTSVSPLTWKGYGLIQS